MGIPLQPVVRTMVEKAVTLQLVVYHGGADISVALMLQPVEDPTVEQVDLV